MANFDVSLRRLRQTRQRFDGSTGEVCSEYQPEYVVVSEATADLAGDPVFDELNQWTIETTEDRKDPPAPKRECPRCGSTFEIGTSIRYAKTRSSVPVRYPLSKGLTAESGSIEKYGEQCVSGATDADSDASSGH